MLKKVSKHTKTLILNGKDLSNTIKNKLKNIISDNNIQPGLGIILVGDRPDSKTYVKMNAHVWPILIPGGPNYNEI